MFSGEEGSCLTLTIKSHGLAAGNSSNTADVQGESGKDSINTIAPKTITLRSEGVLSKSEKNALDETLLEKRFRSLGTGEYGIADLDVTQLGTGLSLPFRDVTALKNEAMKQLNGEQSLIPEVILPKLTSYPKSEADKQPALSLLICDEADVHLADETDADIYFKLPDAYKRNCTKYIGFLQDNPRLIPWFPAVLIGKDYDVAVNILEQVMPPLIITNNTGIAFKANELGIKWIAGPFLNTTNSYALMAMKEDFDCHGAFISNELNRMQMKNIARPENFKLFYSIYHPILLMTSRQCFFQQSVGCEKPRIDNGCMLSCDKSTSITNMKGMSFAIDKQKAGYPSIYNEDQFLNMEVMNDLSDLFDGFMIDLTNIGAGDKVSPDKVALIRQFEQLLAGDKQVEDTLNSMVPASTVSQYHAGL